MPGEGEVWCHFVNRDDTSNWHEQLPAVPRKDELISHEDALYVVLGVSWENRTPRVIVRPAHENENRAFRHLGSDPQQIQVIQNMIAALRRRGLLIRVVSPVTWSQAAAWLSTVSAEVRSDLLAELIRILSSTSVFDNDEEDPDLQVHA